MIAVCWLLILYNIGNEQYFYTLIDHSVTIVGHDGAVALFIQALLFLWW